MQNRYFKSIQHRIAIEKFLVDELWQHLLILGFIILCAWLFNKPVELGTYCLAHFIIRPKCDKEWHCNTNAKCLSVTFTIISIVTLVMLPVNVSLVSPIIVAIFEVYFGYLVQHYLDSAHKSIYAMNSAELYEHCRNCGLDDVECKIAYYVVIERLKGQELYNAINYSERQTKRKRKEILDKIK